MGKTVVSKVEISKPIGRKQQYKAANMPDNPIQSVARKERLVADFMLHVNKNTKAMPKDSITSAQNGAAARINPTNRQIAPLMPSQMP
ncbi:hypothetical protein [Pseudorhodobacter ferrugineus]|uniref:hypothetical protein n=1 Tax=Pseudorhodobacter ferrugineus TaxID=77008 RepID=UPI001E360DF5|nr:hypothetical protein [Pseudorhodobacter ferrugineus]